MKRVFAIETIREIDIWVFNQFIIFIVEVAYWWYFKRQIL